MEKIDPFDDLALAKKPYRVVAALPVHGRIPLLKQTIERLYKKNGCYKVVCAGDGLKEQRLCQSLGAVWVQAPNKPLGNKWNQAFLRAKDFKPDAVLYVGSSDFVCDDWIDIMRPYVDQYHITGTPGCSFADVPLRGSIRAVKWHGYVGERSNESIGIGRLLSKKLLDLLEWKPFDPTKHSSMDSSMKMKCAQFGYHDFMVTDDRAISLSISTDQWDNMHKFNDHWDGKLPSERINDIDTFLKGFPEVYNIFNQKR